MDVPTDGLTFPPLMLLGQLIGVDLKSKPKLEKNRKSKSKPTVNCKNCSYVCAYHCALL